MNPLVILKLDVNEWLPAGGTQLDLMIDLQASGIEGAPAKKTAFILGADVSPSMFYKVDGPEKISMLKKAAVEAVSKLPDGTWFAVLSFSERCTTELSMTQASDATRAQAAAIIEGLKKGNGTCISTALAEARKQAALVPDADTTFYLLTDGDNEEVDSHDLTIQLSQKVPYALKARGFGTDYNVKKLRQIAQTLGGSEQYIAGAAELESDIAQAIKESLGKGLSNVRLRIWFPKLNGLRCLSQDFPEKLDLTQALVVDPASPVDHYLPLGSLGNGRWDYFLSFTVPHKSVGDKRCVARVSVVYDLDGRTVEVPAVLGTPRSVDEGEDPNSVWARWTGETVKSMRVPQAIREYRQSDAVTTDIQSALDDLEGLESAEKSGNRDVTERLRREATEKLTRARAQAQGLGDGDKVAGIDRLLEKRSDGTVQLKRDAVMDKRNTQALASSSVRTVRQPRQLNQ